MCRSEEANRHRYGWRGQGRVLSVISVSIAGKKKREKKKIEKKKKEKCNRRKTNKSKSSKKNMYKKKVREEREDKRAGREHAHV